MAEEKKRLEWWQQFPLDREAVTNLRYMLDIPETEEFPESLWKVMALHKVLLERFQSQIWSSESLAQMIVVSQAFNAYNAVRSDNIRFVAGEKVFVTKAQREGVYWFAGPFARHVVNCHGDIFLVKAADIDAPEAAIVGSELNRHAKTGAKIDEAVQKANAKPAESANAA